MNWLSRIVVKQLKEVADKIETNNCELTEEEAMDILKVIADEPLSKDQACSYLNLSRSRFDELVKLGKLPKGRKRRGFKELVWRKNELILAIKH